MKLITDTGTLLSQQEATELGIHLLPLQVAINNKNYRDYFEISSQEFIPMTKTAVPTSSQPAIGEVMEAYSDLMPALHIAMTKGLSATYNSALGYIESNNINHVTLFNSKTLAGTQQYLVKLANKLRDSHSVDQIIEKMEACLSECQSFLMPEDFDFLKRGGRLSPVAAKLSGFMKIKPIVMQVEGSEKLEKFDVGRNWKVAIDKIIKRMIDNGVSAMHKIYISHAQNERVALMAVEQIKNMIKDADIETLKLSPVMITQGGPGCVAIQYIKKDPSF